MWRLVDKKYFDEKIKCSIEPSDVEVFNFEDWNFKGHKNKNVFLQARLLTMHIVMTFDDIENNKFSWPSFEECDEYKIKTYYEKGIRNLIFWWDDEITNIRLIAYWKG